MDSKALQNGVLSFIIPGLGHAFGGDKQKGIILFAIMIILHLLIYFFANKIFGSGIETLYHLYAGYDAYTNS